MSRLNFKHLRYFWAVARAGSVARASEQLHLAPHSISGQIREFEETLGVVLFRRVGRGLQLTDTGRRLLRYAEEIFSIGDELLEVVRDQSVSDSIPFAVGIADSVPKIVAYRLVEPALRLDQSVRLVCREGRLTTLLADLAVHRLDLVIADRPLPSRLKVRGYSHLLGECGIAICANKQVADQFTGEFPGLLDGAPFLLPGEESAMRPDLERWLDERKLHPRVVGEFDDGALLKAFGRAGAGFFPVPSAVAPAVAEEYAVAIVGRIDDVRERLYAITTERRSTHPATVAIKNGASSGVFVDEPSASSSRRGRKRQGN